MALGERVNGDKLTRWVAVASVVMVALVAAVISYTHIVELITVHGVSNWLHWLYPFAVDGLIMAGSMSMLDSARHHEPSHWLARVSVFGGIAASLGANILTGIDFGILGAIIAGWPAAALVIAYELLMFMIRASARRKKAAEEAESVTVAAVQEATEKPAEPELVTVPNVAAIVPPESAPEPARATELEAVTETYPVASEPETVTDAEYAEIEAHANREDEPEHQGDGQATPEGEDLDEATNSAVDLPVDTGSALASIVPELADASDVPASTYKRKMPESKPTTIRVPRGRSPRRPGTTLRDDWGNARSDFHVNGPEWQDAE